MATIAAPTFGALPTASNYSYTPNGSGGVNYFLNGKPITNTQYRAGTGQDTNSIERSAASSGFATADNPGAGLVAHNTGQLYAAGASANSQPTTNTNLVGGGTVTTGPSAAQTDPLLASLGSLDTILTNKNQQSRDEFGRAIAGYDAQDALDKAAYDKNVHTNEYNLTSGNQAAALSAANGSSGLRGVLSSLGALAGSGADIVKKLVGLAFNNDTGSVRQTFDTNADSLSTQWAQTDQQERQRRSDANATLENNLQNNKSGVLTSRQNILQQLANLYGADNGQGQSYAGQAASLAPEIAATTRASVAPYAGASSLFSPTALQTYLAGTQNLNTTTTASDTPINSPTFTLANKKDLLAGVA